MKVFGENLITHAKYFNKNKTIPNSNVQCHSVASIRSCSHDTVIRPVVVQLRLTLCDPMDRSKPGFPALHCLLEFAQTHVH